MILSFLVAVSLVEPIVPALLPPVFSLGEGQRISARLTGTSQAVQWSFVRAGGWQANFGSMPGAMAIETPTWTVAMMGCDLKPAVPTKEQAAILGPVESLESSALTLVRRADSLAGSPVAVSEAGLRCEIQPMIDPTSQAGGETPLKLKVDGKPRSGVVVHVVVEGSTKDLTLTTNPSGIVNVPHEAGRYLVWALWPDGKVGRSASLTYEVRP